MKNVKRKIPQYQEHPIHISESKMQKLLWETAPAGNTFPCIYRPYTARVSFSCLSIKEYIIFTSERVYPPTFVPGVFVLAWNDTRDFALCHECSLCGVQARNAGGILN
jgi:hypothetical protein